MISELHGELVRKDARGVVVSCAGVGYGVAMSVSALAKLEGLGSRIHLFIHTHMTQEALRLFGFLEAKERGCFEQLLGTTGVGPRLALAILSTLTPEELYFAVESADKSLLVRIPGVGAKKAERLLVELKGRLTEMEGISSHMAQNTSPQTLTDLLSALENLGFTSVQAEAMAKHVRQQHPEEIDLAVLVRTALRASYPLERQSRRH